MIEAECPSGTLGQHVFIAAEDDEGKAKVMRVRFCEVKVRVPVRRQILSSLFDLVESAQYSTLGGVSIDLDLEEIKPTFYLKDRDTACDDSSLIWIADTVITGSLILE